jgi:hypothetical protein
MSEIIDQRTVVSEHSLPRQRGYLGRITLAPLGFVKNRLDQFFAGMGLDVEPVVNDDTVFTTLNSRAAIPSQPTSPEQE